MRERCVSKIQYALFFNQPSTTYIYTYLPTLSLHDALPILRRLHPQIELEFQPLAPQPGQQARQQEGSDGGNDAHPQFAGQRLARSLRDGGQFFGFAQRSEEHTSELQSLMCISSAVFRLKNTDINSQPLHHNTHS